MCKLFIEIENAGWNQVKISPINGAQHEKALQTYTGGFFKLSKSLTILCCWRGAIDRMHFVAISNCTASYWK